MAIDPNNPRLPAFQSFFRLDTTETITVNDGGATVVTFTAGYTWRGIYDLWTKIAAETVIDFRCDPTDYYVTQLISSTTGNVDWTSGPTVRDWFGFEGAATSYSSGATNSENSQIGTFYPTKPVANFLPTYTGRSMRGRGITGEIYSLSMAGDDDAMSFQMGFNIGTDTDFDELDKLDDWLAYIGRPFSYFEDRSLLGDETSTYTADYLLILDQQRTMTRDRQVRAMDILFGHNFQARRIQQR